MGDIVFSPTSGVLGACTATVCVLFGDIGLDVFRYNNVAFVSVPSEDVDGVSNSMGLDTMAIGGSLGADDVCCRCSEAIVFEEMGWPE